MMNKQIDFILDQLQQRETLQPLLPRKVRDQELEARIEALDWNGRETDTDIIALMAGLHLWNDSLDSSHSYAQEIEHDATGAYWHGIMHRMEGDFSNAKYWFHQAGNHPAMEATRQRVAAWLQTDVKLEAAPQGRIRDILLSFKQKTGWSPSPYVDLIAWQERQASSDELRPVLEHIQHIEMTELLNYTYMKACGSASDDSTYSHG